jgi:hypothetical protein
MITGHSFVFLKPDLEFCFEQNYRFFQDEQPVTVVFMRQLRRISQRKVILYMRNYNNVYYLEGITVIACVTQGTNHIYFLQKNSEICVK